MGAFAMTTEAGILHAGQSWSYRAPAGSEASRLVIGAIVTFEGDRTIVCAAVTGLRAEAPSGASHPIEIPFLPMTEAAFRATVVGLADGGEVPPSFSEKLQAWSTDPRGLTAFTVPFEGSLDRMMGAQMAAIASRSAA